MAAFIQIIEIRTSRVHEVEALGDEIRRVLDDGSPGSPLRGRFVEDRDRPGVYYDIVEFESFEAAMRNSGRPETADFAERLTKLCDEPPRFYNLDVREDYLPANG